MKEVTKGVQHNFLLFDQDRRAKRSEKWVWVTLQKIKVKFCGTVYDFDWSFSAVF